MRSKGCVRVLSTVRPHDFTFANTLLQAMNHINERQKTT